MPESILRTIVVTLLAVSGCVGPVDGEPAALTEARLWVPGGIDYSRLNALLETQPNDAMSRMRVDDERHVLLCGPIPREPASFGGMAVNYGADIITGIPEEMSRAAARVIDGEGDEYYRNRWLRVVLTDATDVAGNHIHVEPVWVQDESEIIEVTPSGATRLLLDGSGFVDRSAMGVLAASTGRVVLMVMKHPTGWLGVGAVMPMDGDEIITDFDRAGEREGASRARFSEVRGAYQEALDR